MVALQFVGFALLALLGGILISILVRQFTAGRFEKRREAAELEILQTRLEAARIARDRAQQCAAPWNGWRKFRVDKKVKESPDIFSFYLVPHDRRPLPMFTPGQYLTFELEGIPGESKPAIRCYSLSDCYNPDHYRISVKRVPPPRDHPDAPPGVGSGYLHDRVEEGSLLNVGAPNGNFIIEQGDNRPLVLIGGGIGVTPVRSMFNSIVESRSPREVWFYYGVRHPGENILTETLEALSGRSAEFPNIHYSVCYSDDLGDAARKMKSYERDNSRVTVELIKKDLPSNNLEFFTCGPPAMMEAIKRDLREWGVPMANINEEVFPGPKGSTPKVGVCEGAKVRFRKSGAEVEPQVGCSSLLDLAESNGVDIPFACKVGSCGTCVTAVLSGEVEYFQVPDWKDESALKEEGLCLPCICLPKSELEIDR